MQPFNLEQFAAQASAMQEHLAQMQERLATSTVTEEAGDGLVSLTLGANNRVVDVSIDPSLLNPAQGAYLENLLAEVFTNAGDSMNRLAEEHIAPVSDTISRLTGLGDYGMQKFRESS